MPSGKRWGRSVCYAYFIGGKLMETIKLVKPVMINDKEVSELATLILTN